MLAKLLWGCCGYTCQQCCTSRSVIHTNGSQSVVAIPARVMSNLNAHGTSVGIVLPMATVMTYHVLPCSVASTVPSCFEAGAGLMTQQVKDGHA